MQTASGIQLLTPRQTPALIHQRMQNTEKQAPEQAIRKATDKQR